MNPNTTRTPEDVIKEYKEEPRTWDRVSNDYYHVITQGDKEIEKYYPNWTVEDFKKVYLAMEGKLPKSGREATEEKSNIDEKIKPLQREQNPTPSEIKQLKNTISRYPTEEKKRLAKNPETLSPNPDIQVTTLEILSKDQSHNVRSAVALTPKCPTEILTNLADDDSWKVVEAVAQNPNCPTDLLTKLSRDHVSDIRRAVARNPNCPVDLLQKIAKDKNEDVCQAVAELPNCPPQVLTDLSKDEYSWVRSAVAEHPNRLKDSMETPKEVHEIQRIVDNNEFIKDKRITEDKLLIGDKWIIFMSQDTLDHMKSHMSPSQNLGDAPGSYYTGNWKSGILNVINKNPPETSDKPPFRTAWTGVDAETHVGFVTIGVQPDIKNGNLKRCKPYTYERPIRGEKVKETIIVKNEEAQKTNFMTVVGSKIGEVGGKSVVSLWTAYPDFKDGKINGQSIPMDRNEFQKNGFYFKCSPEFFQQVPEPPKQPLGDAPSDAADLKAYSSDFSGVADYVKACEQKAQTEVEPTKPSTKPSAKPKPKSPSEVTKIFDPQ